MPDVTISRVTRSGSRIEVWCGKVSHLFGDEEQLRRFAASEGKPGDAPLRAALRQLIEDEPAINRWPAAVSEVTFSVDQAEASATATRR